MTKKKITKEILSNVMKTLGRMGSDRIQSNAKELIKNDIKNKSKRFVTVNDKFYNETMESLDKKLYTFKEWLSVNATLSYLYVSKGDSMKPWNICGFSTLIKQRDIELGNIVSDKKKFKSIVDNHIDSMIRFNAQNKLFGNKFFLQPHKDFKSILFILLESGSISYRFYCWYYSKFLFDNEFKIILKFVIWNTNYRDIHH